MPLLFPPQWDASGTRDGLQRAHTIPHSDHTGLTCSGSKATTTQHAAEQLCGSHWCFSMDDFEYSVHISEQDWHSFFLECEECNMLPPVLAGMEDSGMSDMDEIASCRARRDAESRVPEPELQSSSPDHAESPVDLYLSRYGMSSPVHIVSGSEDDLHMESVNMFFEKLKSVSTSEDPLTQKHHSNVGGKTSGFLKGSVEIRDPKEIPVSVDTQSQADDESCKEMRPKSNSGMTPCCGLVKGKDLTGPYQEDSQLVPGGNHDSNTKELVSQGQTSATTPKRKRRKKKRTSTDPAEADHGHDAHFQARQSESDDDIYIRRKVMDRDIQPSGHCGSETVSEIASVPHIWLPPPKIDRILESFPVQPQSLPGNVMDPTVACPDSPTTHQERFESPSTLTSAQNKGRLDFMHGTSDLTEKLASAGQFAITVSLTSTETGVPVKMTGTLMLQNNGCISAPTTADNVGSDLQLSSHPPLGIKAALQGSKTLQALTARNSGNTENPLLLDKGEMNEDCRSSILHYTGSSQVNSQTLLPTVLLPSDPEVCSKAPHSPHAQNQVGETVTLSDTQGAVSQRKTSAPANISCVTFPEIRETMALSVSFNNAENSLTRMTHEEVPAAYRNTHDSASNESLPGTFDSKLTTLSDLVNTEKAEPSPQNAQKQASLSADTTESTYSTFGQEAVTSNAFVNGSLTLCSQSDDWKKKEISSSLRPKDITDLPGTHQKQTELLSILSGSEDNNERLPLEESRKYQPLITSPEAVETTLSTAKEQNYEMNHAPPYHPFKDYEMSASTTMQGMASHIHESAQKAKGLETGNDRLSLHSQYEDSTEEGFSFIGSKDVTDSPEGGDGIGVEKVGMLSSDTEEINEMLQLRKSELGEDAQMLHISLTSSDEEIGEVHCLASQIPAAKDYELLPGVKLNGTASPTPESVDGAECVSSDIIATDDKEKNEIQYVPPNFLCASTASSTPESNDGAKHLSLNITTADEQNYGVHYLPPHCPSEDQELSPSAIMQIMASPTHRSAKEAKGLETGNDRLCLRSQCEELTEVVPSFIGSKDITDCLQSGKGIDMEGVGILSDEYRNEPEQDVKLQDISNNEENDEVGYVLPHCPAKDHTTMVQGTESSIPGSMNGIENMSSKVITTGDKENNEVLNAPSSISSKDHELSPSAITQCIASSTTELNDGATHISSNIFTAGGEENHDVHNVPPQCPSKDHKFPLSVITQGTASSAPESIDGTDHLLSITTTTGDKEEKGEAYYAPPGCPPKDLELSPCAVMHGMDSPAQSVEASNNLDNDNRHPMHLKSEDLTAETTFRSNRITELPGSCLKEQVRKYPPLIEITGPESQLRDDLVSEHISCDISSTANEGKTEVHYVPPHCPLNDHDLSRSAIMQSVASYTPQSTDGAEHMLSSINTEDEEKDEVHNMPSNFPSKDQDLSPSEITEGMASPTPEPMDEARSLETIDAVSQSPHPVYAISSFWNEMEKLTINDILRLRLVGQAQHPSVLLQSEDSGIVDISDAADSGYFTHLDDSKPDRSSGDMSYISDFEEELAQLQTQEAAKLDEGSRESPNSEDAMWENDMEPSATGTGMEDVFILSSETALPSPLYRDNAQQCFRKMCKNISVQNLQALEAEPIRKILRNASLLSLHSIHAEVEDDYVDPFDRVDASSPVCLSDEEDEEIEGTGITFSEIIQFLFGGDEPEHCTTTADNTASSYLDGTGTSVPETYDHFFSEFEDGSLFYPLTSNTTSSNDELVPIFSCSRSANRNLQFPEVYDYFFPDDSPVHSDEDEERDQTVIQVVTRHDHMADHKNHSAVAAADTYEELPPETGYGWNFLRNNPLSFRRARRSDFTAPPEKSSSWALAPVKNSNRSFQRGIQPINAMGPDEKPFPDPLLFSLENRIFRQLANQQNICNEMQTAVADPRIDAPLMPLKQADMCLVCIAFASWVLKSANPQGADMWKADIWLV
ncbi:hypothetical protein NFI96_003461 [Prochilodus magdalenae]|nr:hypothetical protein NFI96_003461 [Prochilodus magdalenae]